MQLKKVLISFFIIGIVVLLGIVSSKYFNEDDNLNSDKALISYYVETGEGTGVYEKQEGATWPEGYVLNEEKSSCDNGSILSWDSSTNSVVVTASKEDNCKVYLEVPVLRTLQFNYEVPNAEKFKYYFSLNGEVLTDGQIVQYKKGDVLVITPQYGDATIYFYDDNNQLIDEVFNSSFEENFCDEFTYVLTGKEAKIIGPNSDGFVPSICPMVSPPIVS